jgi:hypothetical protein
LSRRNGDRARFQINRKRRLLLRQRLRALRIALSERRDKPAEVDESGVTAKPR